jgi:hypothetical protein
VVEQVQQLHKLKVRLELIQFFQQLQVQVVEVEQVLVVLEPQQEVQVEVEQVIQHQPQGVQQVTLLL